MKNYNTFYCFILLFFVYSGSFGAEKYNNELELSELLPKRGELNKWKPEGEAEFALGDNLYLIINGGAEIYNEYGFKKAAFQTYSSESGHLINLEVYEMSDASSAYGMYSFKTDTMGKPVNIGQDGCLSDYYLNFWKGNFLVTIVGLDTHQETIDGVMAIARAVDEKIKMTATKSKLIDFMPEENLFNNGIKFLKGPLALFNIYSFDSQNIFGLSEGVFGLYKGYSIFLFKYDSQTTALNWYNNAKMYLSKNESYTNFKKTVETFIIKDSEDVSIIVKNYREFILIILSHVELNSASIFKKCQDRIDVRTN